MVVSTTRSAVGTEGRLLDKAHMNCHCIISVESRPHPRASGVEGSSVAARRDAITCTAQGRSRRTKLLMGTKGCFDCVGVSYATTLFIQGEIRVAARSSGTLPASVIGEHGPTMTRTAPRWQDRRDVRGPNMQPEQRRGPFRNLA